MQLHVSADGVNGNISYAGDVTKGIYAWGLELKAGALPGGGGIANRNYVAVGVFNLYIVLCHARSFR
jgi:hypothetical protein